MTDPIALDDIDEDFIRQHPDRVEEYFSSLPERTKYVWTDVMYINGNWHTFDRVIISGNGPSVGYWTIPDPLRGKTR